MTLFSGSVSGFGAGRQGVSPNAAVHLFIRDLGNLEGVAGTGSCDL